MLEFLLPALFGFLIWIVIRVIIPGFYTVDQNERAVKLNLGRVERVGTATALKHFGIPCVIAASFSETYKRNAFNNGFVVFECPELVQQLRQCPNLTPYLRTRDAGEIDIDLTSGVLTVTLGGISRTFPFPALSRVAQNLVVAGGAERAVAQRLAN